MKLLLDIPRSSRYTILLHPLWAIFGSIVLFYASNYMKALGLSEIQIGSISTISQVFGFIWLFLASPINNKLGRKKTLFIFDFICWTVPMIIWAIAGNYWLFLAAAIINSCVKVSTVAWNCLLSEDVSMDKQAKVYSMINLLNTLPGILILLGSFIIREYGIVPSMRAFYFFGALLMTACFILRNRLITETQVGAELLKTNCHMSIVSSLKAYLPLLVRAHRNMNFVRLELIFMITNFIAVFLLSFQVLFMTYYLDFSEEQIGYSRALFAVVSLVLYLLLSKRGVKSEKNILTFSFLISIFGMLLLVMTPKGNLLLMLTANTLISIGSFLHMTYRNSLLMNTVSAYEKSEMFSVIQVTMSVASIPAGYLGGYTYTIHPVIPFVGITVLFFVAAVISRFIYVPAYSEEERCAA